MTYIFTVNSYSDEKAETSRRLIWAIRFALLFASLLMIAAARGDLWLDEIWSLSFARDAKSVADIFVRFQHDNNHPLNTLFLHICGEQKIFLIYRLFAVFSGVGSLFLIGHIAKKEWGYREALCGILLAGTSYPLLLYFSEARGYAPEIFFALACYALLYRNAYDFSKTRLILFWTASVLGMLSHSTFIIATLAFCVGNLTDSSSTIESIRQKSLRFFAHHVPPLVFYAWWYVFYLKNMIIGGGPVYQIWDVAGQGSAMLLGFPQTALFSITAMLCVCVIILAGVVMLYRECNPRWLFFLIMLIFSPIAIYNISRPVIIYFRYFLVCFPFFYLLFSHMICKYCRTSPGYRWIIAVFVLIIFLTGQADRDYRLIESGRGQYRSTLEYIAENQTGTVNIGSNHDFRIKMLFDFYTPLVTGGSRLCYIDRSKWDQKMPDWIISENITYLHPDEIIVNKTWKYYFIKGYRSADVSGSNWFLYRLDHLTP